MGANVAGCEEGAGLCAMFITIGSLILIVVSLPLSLFFVVKVVQVLCRSSYLCSAHRKGFKMHRIFQTLTMATATPIRGNFLCILV